MGRPPSIVEDYHEWQRRLERRQSSEASLDVFCLQEGISRSTFFRWKRRLDKLRADGKDHALVYASWSRPSADDRAVVYQKGAYVLHLLREELGERAFWRGIRAYTRAHYGHSVVTSDFRQAMERASGRDLSGFFARWVEPGEAMAK